MTCPKCGKQRPLPWALYDRRDRVAGMYCTKRCAQNSAFGSRFTSWRVERREPGGGVA